MKKNLDALCRFSQDKLSQLQKEFETTLPKKYKEKYGICIYACGSLGRMELGEASDLDLFFISHSFGEENGEGTIPKADKEEFFSAVKSIGKELDFPPPSKNGKYLKFTPLNNLLDIGSSEEDYNNSFTARMLLLLESKPLYNLEAYDHLVKSVVEKYFVDYPPYKRNFYPLFLMNDIRRYWYTLCLNYEYRRDDDDDRAQRYRKRLKLKFARRITCFSMLACLYEKGVSPDYVIACVKKTPFERFEMLAQNSKELIDTLQKIRKEYEHYLILKTHSTSWWGKDPARKENAFKCADSFQHLLNYNFLKEIAKKNPPLLERIDLY